MAERQHEEGHSDPSRKASESASNKKHAAMLDRLSRRDRSRQQQSSSKKTYTESTDSFLNRFSELQRSIQNSLDQIRGSSDPDVVSDLKSDISHISVTIASLEKLVAENSYFLPSYEVRNSLKIISELKHSLEIASAELAPRNKFSFRSKPSNKDDSGRAARSVFVENVTNVTLPPPLPISWHDDAGFRNEQCAVLTKDFSLSEGADFSLSNLVSCEIRLRGCLRALFVHRLQNCRVSAGPVFGSVLIEEAEQCVFMLASHQIRIHSSKNTDFYIRVRSRPIIEDSCGLRFSPYKLVYDGIEEDLRSSGLEEDNGNWANVDDFKWLRLVQSPNWCILPEEERALPVANMRLEGNGDDI